MFRLAFAATLLLSSIALAKPSGAVLDIQGTGVDPNLLPTLTEVLTVEVDNLGFYKVIAGRDVQAMLGFEQQKDVVGCTDAACLAEIGGALGVDRIVASHIGKVGSTYVVNIKLINIRMEDTEARAYETVRDEVDALIDTIRRSVDSLLGAESDAARAAAPATAKPKPKPKPKVVAAPTQETEPEPKAEPRAAPPRKVAAATEPPTVEAKKGGGVPIVPVALVGAGGVAVGVGVVFGIRAKGLEGDATEKLPESDVYAAGAQSAAEGAKTSALIANIAYGAGIVMAGVGAVLWLVGGSTESGTTAMVPIVGPDQTGVAFTGSF
jgi:hypothetical protein